MKITIQTNNNRVQSRRNGAFTLIEMIGVLAIIAILAALLVPKVFNAISEARVSNTSVSIDSMKTAVTDHYGKYGGLNVSNTSPLTVTTTYPGFDTVLLGEGLIDKLLSVKIGTNAVVQLATGTAANNSTGYNLGGGVLTTNQSYTAEVVLQGVALQDAYDLKNQIDGVPVTSGTLTNLTGRVEFAGTGNPTTVYVYLTGR